VRRIHRGVLDGLRYAEIAARYLAEPGEAALVTRLTDGRVVELSRNRMRDGAEQALKRLEAEGCDVILILCTGRFEGLQCERAWLVEPDHIIPASVAGLVEKRQLGVIVPIASQIDSERDKWRPLARTPLFAAVSPYSDGPEAVLATGERLSGGRRRGSPARLHRLHRAAPRHPRRARHAGHLVERRRRQGGRRTLRRLRSEAVLSVAMGARPLLSFPPACKRTGPDDDA
jgi:hypothetical protein